MNERGVNGLIDMFARHEVAGNLLMLLMIMFGIWGVTELNRQVMPNFDLDLISITVEWPGASPEDVEQNIITAIEPEIRFLDDVKRVVAVAYEGRAAITMYFNDGVNISRSLTDVQAAVARITTFPNEIERPVVQQVADQDPVSQIQISGPYSEQALKLVAKRIRDDLLDLGMSRITLAGIRDSEIWVEISPETLRQLDLTLSDVAGRIEQYSLDLPSGSVDTGGLSRQIRSESLARNASEVGQIEVVSEGRRSETAHQGHRPDLETFEANAVSRVKRENPSVGLVVTRSGSVDSIDAQQTADRLHRRVQQEYPDTLEIEMFDVFADQVTQRVSMLVSNGIRRIVSRADRVVHFPERPGRVLGRDGYSDCHSRCARRHGDARHDAEHDQHVRDHHGSRVSSSTMRSSSASTPRCCIVTACRRKRRRARPPRRCSHRCWPRR